MIISSLAPTLATNVSPLLLTGDSGEDPIELLCKVIVREDVALASYKFTWMKDDIPIDLSNGRFVVCMYKHSGNYFVIVEFIFSA